MKFQKSNLVASVLKIFSINLIFISLFFEIIYCQDYQAYEGSVYWSFDMGYDSYFGTIRSNEDLFLKNNNLEFYTTDSLGRIDTTKAGYSYSGFGGNINVLFFKNEHLSVGPMAKFNFLFQHLNVNNYNELISGKFNVGIVGGYYLPTNWKISFFPTISLAYTHERIYRLAAISTLETTNDNLKKLVDENDNEIISNGLSSIFEIRAHFFPFSGRFSCYLGLGYDFSLMFSNDDNNFYNYSKTYYDNRLFFKIGASYLTE